MLGDLGTFVAGVFSHWLAWIGLLSTALRIWAELSERADRTFLGNRPLWTALAVVFLFAACFQTWREEHTHAVVSGPSFALVGRDGKLISQRDFEQYGLIVERRDEPAASGRSWPTYYLGFEHEPEIVDVRTDEGATVQKERVGPGRFKVIFIGAGFGSPVVEASFKIEAR